MDYNESYDTIGSVSIKQLYIVPIGVSAPPVNLEEFLIELNLYESITSPFLTGDVILSDTVNLVRDIPLLGEELLILELHTPTFPEDDVIFKTFKINSVKQKQYDTNGNTLVYKLTFSSIEMYADLLLPINQAFSGNPNDIVKNIYEDYLLSSRTLTIQPNQDVPSIYNDAVSPLTLISKISNTIKFVSPGWSPSKCINWIAGKSKGQPAISSSFLFWETTKGFYFGSMSEFLKEPEKYSIGDYIFSQTVTQGQNDKLKEKFYSVKRMVMKQNFDQLQNNLTGYLASRVIDVDIFNKNYEIKDYDHLENFFSYYHMNKGSSLPLFSLSSSRNPESFKVVNYNYPKLFDSSDNNFSEIYKDVFGDRRSNINELLNFKMEITIAGRTDIEVGNTINLIIYENKPMLDMSSIGVPVLDDLYSGYYLITAINHKINRMSHFITMEIHKDSFPSATGDE